MTHGVFSGKVEAVIRQWPLANKLPQPRRSVWRAITVRLPISVHRRKSPKQTFGGVLNGQIGTAAHDRYLVCKQADGWRRKYFEVMILQSTQEWDLSKLVRHFA